MIIGSVGASVIWWIRRELAGIAALARAARPPRGSGAIVADLEHRIRADGVELPPPETVAGEAERKSRRFDRDVEHDLSRPHHHADRLQFISDHRLLRLFQLGADAVDFARHRGDEVARPTLSSSPSPRRSVRCSGCSSPTASSANGRSPGRRWALRSFGLLFAQQTSAAAVIVCGLLITLCNNWLSFSFHAYQAELYPTRIRAQAVGFVYSWSRFSAIFSGFIIAFFLARYGTTRRVQLHCRRHGDRLRRDRRIRAGGDPTPARSHRGVARHCERSEAIQNFISLPLDCFVALWAPRNDCEATSLPAC